jgi:hypothetical protein
MQRVIRGFTANASDADDAEEQGGAGQGIAEAEVGTQSKRRLKHAEEM